MDAMPKDADNGRVEGSGLAMLHVLLGNCRISSNGETSTVL